MIFSNRFEKHLRVLTDTTLNILQRNDSRKKRRERGKERRGEEKERKRKNAFRCPKWKSSNASQASWPLGYCVLFNKRYCGQIN